MASHGEWFAGKFPPFVSMCRRFSQLQFRGFPGQPCLIIREYAHYVSLRLDAFAGSVVEISHPPLAKWHVLQAPKKPVGMISSNNHRGA